MQEQITQSRQKEQQGKALALAGFSPDQTTALAGETPEDRAAFHYKHLDAHLRSSVAHAWHLGAALRAMKTQLGHGRYLPWLDSRHAEGIGPSQRTATNAIRLNENFKLATIANFDSVKAALDTLPKRRRIAPVNDAEPTAPPTPQQTIDTLQHDLATAQSAAEDLRERVSIMESSASAVERDRFDVVNNLREQLKTAKSQVGLWQSRHAEERREVNSLRRQNKKLRKELETYRQA